LKCIPEKLSYDKSGITIGNINAAKLSMNSLMVQKQINMNSKSDMIEIDHIAKKPSQLLEIL
jgi:hypothetical protein